MSNAVSLTSVNEICDKLCVNYRVFAKTSSSLMLVVLNGFTAGMGKCLVSRGSVKKVFSVVRTSHRIHGRLSDLKFSLL